MCEADWLMAFSGFLLAFLSFCWRYHAVCQRQSSVMIFGMIVTIIMLSLRGFSTVSLSLSLLVLIMDARR